MKSTDLEGRVKQEKKWKPQTRFTDSLVTEDGVRYEFTLTAIFSFRHGQFGYCEPYTRGRFTIERYERVPEKNITRHFQLFPPKIVKDEQDRWRDKKAWSLSVEGICYEYGACGNDIASFADLQHMWARYGVLPYQNFNPEEELKREAGKRGLVLNDGLIRPFYILSDSLSAEFYRYKSQFGERLAGVIDIHTGEKMPAGQKYRGL